MPGFPFPAVGPLDLGSPPYRSEQSDHRYYGPLRLPNVHLGFVRCSLSAPNTLVAPLISLTGQDRALLSSARTPPHWLTGALDRIAFAKETFAWDRNTARAALDGEFPKHALFRYVRRVPNSTIAHVSVSPPFHPGRSDFPSPVGDPDSPRWAFPLIPKLKRWFAYTPCINGLPTGSTHHGIDQLIRLKVLGCAALAPVKCREPLCPQIGVTSCAVMSRITSEGITPPSSLIRAHGPDQNPPVDFSCPYFNGPLQVVTSPCWELALPDIISAILVWVPGPLPRSAPLVHMLASSQRTPASPQRAQVRRAK